MRLTKQIPSNQIGGSPQVPQYLTPHGHANRSPTPSSNNDQRTSLPELEITAPSPTLKAGALQNQKAQHGSQWVSAGVRRQPVRPTGPARLEGGLRTHSHESQQTSVPQKGTQARLKNSRPTDSPLRSIERWWRYLGGRGGDRNQVGTWSRIGNCFSTHGTISSASTRER